MSCKCLNDVVDVIGLGECEDIDLTENLSWTEISIPEVFYIPCEKPEIETIDKVFVKVDIISKRLVDTPAPPNATDENQEGTRLSGKKLVIEGILKQRVVYTADVPQQTVHSAHFCKPFSAFIVIDPADIAEEKFDVETCIEDVFIMPINKKKIFKNVTLFLRAIPCN
ncbi:DUF3794 domain-containing protein [Haloimpatiens sp. FM7330]|uniref:DUF3794 domain-containing protein n=1 Tax=Haloimpatiens sp. FM7330 TaxID=3298610 RepID=UPI003632BA7F